MTDECLLYMKQHKVICIPVEDVMKACQPFSNKSDYTSTPLSNITIATTPPSLPLNISFQNITDERNSQQMGKDKDYYRNLEALIYKYCLFFMCLVGIIGNALNLIVLTRVSLKRTMDLLEKASNAMFVAIAVSDMSFCFSLIFYPWLYSVSFMHSEINVRLIYTIYYYPLINIFAFASTWLTLVATASRFLLIVDYPIGVKVSGLTSAKIQIFAVFLVSIGSNLIRFWYQEISILHCYGNYSTYYVQDSILKKDVTLHHIYSWAMFVVGTIIPLLMLIFFTIFFASGFKVAEFCCKTASNQIQESNHTTLTLAIMVILNLVLVCPAEIVAFFKYIAVVKYETTPVYNIIVSITNVAQAGNFALNFLVYFVANPNFRRTFIHLICRTSTQKISKGIRNAALRGKSGKTKKTEKYNDTEFHLTETICFETTL